MLDSAVKKEFAPHASRILLSSLIERVQLKVDGLQASINSRWKHLAATITARTKRIRIVSC